MFERLKKRQQERLESFDNSATFISKKARELESASEIPNDLYIQNNVKRGLRNSNGTGVVVGLTRIGEVCGYTVGENKAPTFRPPERSV